MPSPTRRAVRLRPRHTPTGSGHRYAVFTAIDGTLLDARTFSAGANRAAIRRLAAQNIPVIPVSVMTMRELAPIAATLGMQRAMIVEAGGAIGRWNGEAWDVEPCGPPAETLLDVVRDIEERSGANLLVYSALPPSDAAQFSGRSGEMLHASQARTFSEPFVIESGELDAVSRAAAAIGFSIRRGRRFLHLCRECDEGEAFTRVRAELQCETAIAIGSAAVDAEFLARADVAIVLPGENGEVDRELVAKVPHARVAPSPAPSGWAQAIEELLPSLERPRARTRRA